MKKLIVAAMVVVLSACGGGDNMAEVTYFRNGDESLVEGNILLMWVNYQTEDGQDLLRTRPQEPLAMLYDSSSVEQSGLIKGIIDDLKIGDSVAFSIPSKNLWEVSFNRPLPDTIGENSSILVNLGIVNQMTKPEYNSYMGELEMKRNAAYYEA
ncbi:MAG: hypothetical protein HKN76_20760, partial [Saprospiraceae bacterium]|nr:hypothetical protein [Saprospiraceae bacterium]